ncbi:glycosyltransferase family 10 domain-containing protein [Ruegeria lacuscaerulensis]|uniref:glycosyltransferase family 10 domain-containing protein n=1 Tax=Ruegeria lacuscaerulensis TaxID=55218 RepID=UPI00147BACEE|nr:glycosyltransferase family 10 [Ruegeria lacuscaerulensis]
MQDQNNVEEPAIAFLPYGQTPGPNLRNKPVSELLWPLGMPERLLGKKVGEMSSDDHLIVTAKTSLYYRRDFGTAAKISVVIVEPSTIHRKHLRLMKVFHRRFYRVISFNEKLLASIPNGVFLPFGLTLVPDWGSLEIKKTAMISLIASSKRDTEGHRLRHSVVDWLKKTDLDVSVMGRGYAPFESKSDGLAPFRYSVVIENTREPNYFTEKLIDAVFCETVPIYWGCPNLTRFMDPDGIIQCQSETDIRRAIEAASEEDYLRRLTKIKRLKSVMEKYADYNLNAVTAIRDAVIADRI